MINVNIARLSAKKPTKLQTNSSNVSSTNEEKYNEILEKYKTTNSDITTWMDKIKGITTEIGNMTDITPDVVSEYLASAKGFGVNHTSVVFLMIHSALAEKKILIPMNDIPVMLSEEERQHLLTSNANPHPNMTERLLLSTNKSYDLRVDRDNWFEIPTLLKVNTVDMIDFMMLSKCIQHLAPLKDLVRFISKLPFTTRADSMEIWKKELNVGHLPTLDITVTPIMATNSFSHTSKEKLVALVLTNTVTALHKGDNRNVNWYIKNQVQTFAAGQKQVLTDKSAGEEILEAIEALTDVEAFDISYTDVSGYDGWKGAKNASNINGHYMVAKDKNEAQELIQALQLLKVMRYRDVSDSAL